MSRHPADDTADRPRLQTAAVGALAVLALVLAAATLTTAVDTSREQPGGDRRGPLRNLTDWGIDIADITPTGEEVEEVNASGGASGRASDQPRSVTRLIRTNPFGAVLAVALVALALVGAVYLRRWDRENDESGQAQPRSDRGNDDEGDDRSADVGSVAGAAADRIADDGAETSLENEVYRAWWEMASRLTVDDPATSTPAEFADAAVAAGLDPNDVDELTDLFRAVRYGGQEVTDRREERAVETLRRIEARYGGDGE